jgi:hypothetical protein
MTGDGIDKFEREFAHRRLDSGRTSPAILRPWESVHQKMFETKITGDVRPLSSQ